MQEQDQPSAMRRKAGAGRPPPEIGQFTPAKALRTAVAQAAEDVAGLVAAAGAVEEARVTLDEVGHGLPELPLLALVEGPGGGFGLVVLDAQAVAALIEMQTTGRVAPRSAEPRAPTRTDAIMCADFIDRVLEVLEQRVGEAGLALAPALTGYRYAVALAEPRAVATTLEDLPYRRFSLSVDFGRGAKLGGLQIILPHDAPGPDIRTGADAGAFSQALQAQVMQAQAVLSAVLVRHRLTLADLAALDVGAEIPVPREVLGDVALEDLEGRVVARGRLGQAGGHRALRLTATERAEDASEQGGPTGPSVPRLEAAVPLGHPQAEAEVGSAPDATETAGNDFPDMSVFGGEA